MQAARRGLRCSAAAARLSTAATGTHVVASPFQEQQRAERDRLLRNVYKAYWDARAKGNQVEEKSLAASGEMFERHWRPFRSRAANHAELLADREYSALLPPVYPRRPYHISPHLAARLTAASCRLEGSTMTVQDVQGLHVSPDSLVAARLPSHAPISVSSRSSREVNEAYFHLLALYHGQALVLRRDPLWPSCWTSTPC